MKNSLAFALIAVVAISAIGCASKPSSQTQPPLTVTLRNPYSGVVGNATFSPDPAGIKVSVQVKGLTPGKHGVHIHMTGKCEGFDFASAGGHFNPNNKQHGMQNPQGAHAGDMPNLEVGADGSGTYEYINKQVTFGSGSNSLFPPGGTALVIHAGEEKENPRAHPAGFGRLSVQQEIREWEEDRIAEPAGGGFQRLG